MSGRPERADGEILVGMTYDLRQDYLDAGFGEEETAEFDKPDTVEGIREALEGLGYRTDRIGNIRHLVSRLAAGDRWDLVFNIAEGLHGFGREAQVPALLDAYGIPYTFSDPLALSLTLHKGMAKRVVRDAGVPTADFALVETPEDADSVRLPYPLFAKPVAEGTGKGISPVSKIASPDELRNACRLLLERYRQPVLVETFLPGREYTVGILGTGKDAAAIGVMEIIFGDRAEGDFYSYVNKEQYEGRMRYRPAEDAGGRAAGRTALAAWRALGCRDAGRIDIREDAAGTPCFIEVNPLAGLNPTHSDLPILARMQGIEFHSLIGGIMACALRRLRAEGAAQRR